MKGGGGLILPIFLLLLINKCSIVEAGIFLKVKEPVVIQKAVWLYSNSTAITSIAPDVPANKFSKSIAPLNNVPEASTDGTIGILYNRDDSCTATIQQPIPYPFYAASPKLSKVPKIAFIKKQGGNCTLVEKINIAQSEGAVGAIVYDTIAMTNTYEDHKTGVPPDSGITIPAYYADHSVGVELYHQLEKMAGVPTATIPTFDNSNLTTRISVRIALMPPENVKANAWELTLLVMLVLLGTSVLFSVAMHFYMWKKNQRLQSVVERHRTSAAGANPLPMGKALLTVAILYQFPTRIIDTLPDEEERKKVETVLSDEKQREGLIKSTALSSTNYQPSKDSKTIFIKKKLLRKQSSSPSVAIKIDAPVNNICVICLEVFKMGDEVRELPCHHEYHTMCIDPWLTSKSGECPLCKYDCSDSKSEQTIADPDGLIAAASVPGLRGMILRPYLRFKANRRQRIGQVGVATGSEQQTRQQQSRQSTMVTNTEAPPSPGLRAVEAVEALIATTIALDAAEEQQHQHGNESLYESSHQREDSTTIVIDTPRQSTATEMTEVTNNHQNIDEQHEYESQPRFSTTTNRDETDTINTATAISISNYAPASDGGLLPDIDVSSISLCSIDLGGLSEDFHNSFNNTK